MKLMVVDRNNLFRQGLIKLLSAQPSVTVIGEASDSWEAVTEARKLKPDLIIIEPCPTQGLGLEAIKQMRQELPEVKIMALTESEQDDDIYQTIRSGAQGYIIKSSTQEQLFSAIEDIMKGGVCISPSVTGKIIGELLYLREEKEDGTVSSLTTREREIIELLCTGITDNEIGNRLQITPSTVRHHVHSILHKLRLKNRMQLAIFSRSQKLTSLKNLETGK